ncbi:peptidyl-prolyl cis-trans isomerase FKBP62-like [Octopus vulgaris]|uniref:Peptidyl-prolyl cis-trans isomerase FKBP62-like n=1 Tax=Octopus vulgaris TaxID=6645 RepID=A0AA36B7K9_OCTVU|nr:peptidyl-prolyl cis-trans isomerase FKBP62-like [Octopus vulgaris]
MDDKCWTSPNNSISKEILKFGSGLAKPTDGSICIVSISHIGGADLNKDSLGYGLGENVKIQIGEGDTIYGELIDECLESMKLDECCEATFHILLESSKDSCDQLEKYKLQLELHKFENPTNSWEMTIEEKLAVAMHHRKKGSELFKAGNIEFAFKRYRKALKYVITIDSDDEMPEDVRTEYQNLKSTLFVNISLCQSKYESNDFVIANCTSALFVDKNNVKALYHRAQAQLNTRDLDRALADIKAGLELEPNNQVFLKLQKIVNSKLKVHTDQMKKAMTKMFLQN